jgi:hypothetical protein
MAFYGLEIPDGGSKKENAWVVGGGGEGARGHGRGGWRYNEAL